MDTRMPQNGSTVTAEVESKSVDYDLFTGCASLQTTDVPARVFIDDVFDDHVYWAIHHDGAAGDLQVGSKLTAGQARQFGHALIRAAEVLDD